MTVFNTFKELDDYCADPANSLENVVLGPSLTSLSRLFEQSERTEEQFKGIEKWDVSRVTDFSYMFFKARNFNSDISGWNVGQAVTMRDMFCHASMFNKPLDKWDVSNVTDMTRMFSRAKAFNQSLARWNVRRVESMEGMFMQAFSFNQRLDSWCTENLKNTNCMFCSATSFNQPLEHWNMKSVTDCGYMFSGAKKFCQYLNGWNFDNEDLKMFKDTEMTDEKYPWVKRAKSADELKSEPMTESFKAYRNYEDKLKKLFGHCA